MVADVTTAATLTEGFDLKISRLRRGVTQQAIAAAIGCHRSRIAAIEREARPSRRAVARYLAALEEAAG